MNSPFPLIRLGLLARDRKESEVVGREEKGAGGRAERAKGRPDGTLRLKKETVGTDIHQQCNGTTKGSES